MASSIALKKPPSSSSSSSTFFLNKLRSVPVVPSGTGKKNNYDVDGDTTDDDERRSDSSASRGMGYSSPIFFADVFDPFLPTPSFIEVIDETRKRGIGDGEKKGMSSKEDKDNLFLWFDMPGLGKDNVKVSVEKDNILIVKGECEKKEDQESGRKYRYSADLGKKKKKSFKVKEMKAEMKNGVLKVVVPKLVEEESKDVFNVNVD